MYQNNVYHQIKYVTLAIGLVCGIGILISSCKKDDDNDDEEDCTETIWYEDADGDGLGNPAVTALACVPLDGYVDNNDDDNDDSNSSGDPDNPCLLASPPMSAFEEFNKDAVSISFDGDEVTIESTGLPNHTSPYWETTDPLHIDQVVGDHLTPGAIRAGSYTLTASTTPEVADLSSATGLGAIGISVTGAPIFNDQERENMPLDVETALGFDYAGGHVGPGGYHYHIESSDVPENTTLSFDDEQLVGIMADGFLLYGRKCHATGDHPTDLDISGGHCSSTQHSDEDSFYHYHIINEFYVNAYILLFGGDLQGTPNAIL